jgi:uncharacterized MAPEG superfamily protein
MRFEYQALAVMTILFSFGWVPVSVGKARAFGGKWLASNREPLPGKELEPSAARADRAYANLKDYFPAFIVAGRVGHYAAYAAGSVWGRAGTFAASFFANLYLLVKVLI